MKKQIRKLSLNKKTISNLSVAEMGEHVGGSTGTSTSTSTDTKNPGGHTKNGKTCPGHNTCYNC